MQKTHIGYLIKGINDKIKVNADSDLSGHNLTMAQSRVLVYLLNKGGKATQKQIEDYLEVSHPTVVGIVSRMEKNGFLTSKVDQEDHRNRVIELTSHAYTTGKDMDKVVSKMEKDLLSPLSETQIKELTKLLELIYQNVK